MDSPVNIEVIRYIILGVLVVLHTVITINNFLFIILFALGKHSSFVDFIVICSVVSFLVYSKCIFVDVYNFIKGNSSKEEIPEYAKENYFKVKLQQFLRKNDNYDKDLTDFRLDILTNTTPLLECKTNDELRDMFNFKVHYLTISIILCVLLMIKYDLRVGLPLLVVWFFSVFTI